MSFEFDILSWLKKNGSALSISIRLDEGFNYQFPNFFRAWAEIPWKGHLFSVQGIARSPERAISICVSEFVERVVVVESKSKTSSGFAAYPELASASSNAISELLERDAFFCHFLTDTPFDSFDFQQCIQMVDPSLSDFIDQMMSIGVEFKLGSMKALGSGVSFVVCASSRSKEFKFGALFETHYGYEPIRTLEKILLDLSVNLRWLYGNRHLIHLPNQLFGKDEHLNQGMKDIYRNWFEEMFTSSVLSVKSELYVRDISIPKDIEKENLQIPHELFCPPIFVVKASCESLQPHFCGPFSTDKVNLMRLQDFTGRSIALEDLTKLPSIFG